MTEQNTERRNRGRKPKQQETQLNQQETQLNQQEELPVEAKYEVTNHEQDKNVETAENFYEDTPKKTENNNTTSDMLLTKTAQRIMNRLYEIYGYTIKGDMCRRIVQTAQSYASRENINIKDDIKEINIAELYNNVLNVLSLGYVPSPLDNTYNSLLIKAIIDKYKV
jgi:hypothetical protein